jgi:hypothetical protein
MRVIAVFVSPHLIGAVGLAVGKRPLGGTILAFFPSALENFIAILANTFSEDFPDGFVSAHNAEILIQNHDKAWDALEQYLVFFLQPLGFRDVNREFDYVWDISIRGDYGKDMNEIVRFAAIVIDSDFVIHPWLAIGKCLGRHAVLTARRTALVSLMAFLPLSLAEYISEGMVALNDIVMAVNDSNTARHLLK